MISIDGQQLESFAVGLLRAGGVSETESNLVAESLVGANLRGHDSHGVMRIPYYLDELQKGGVVRDAPLDVLRQTESVIVADGNWGFGQTQAGRLTQLLMEKVKESGIAVGTLIRSCHVGRLGEYCEKAAQEGLVAMMMVNTHGHARRVAPPGGKAPRLGTNPIAFGIPYAEEPVIVDFGTSATAEGKVRVKRIAGEKCPAGWLLDNEGRPTTDPDDLYADPPGTILPMGGDQAYKGFALGLTVEIFAGALSGGACIREIPINQIGNCAYMQLIDPAAVGGANHFTQEVAQLLEFVRGCPRIEGVEEILLPGDPERKILARRSAGGIPLDAGNWNKLLELAKKLGVTAPSVE